MKKGFIYLEVLIATLIALLMNIFLLSALYQSNRAQIVVDNNIDTLTKAITIQHQFERDLTGALIPVTGTQPPSLSPGYTKETVPKHSVEYAFYSKNDNNNVSILTFFTNNPLRAYWGEKTDNSNVRMARVVYKLRLEPGKNNSYALTRQEGQEHRFSMYTKEDNAKKIRSYQLANGIKECSITFFTTHESKQEKKRTVTQTKEWHFSTGQYTEKGSHKTLPHFLKIKIVLWDNTYKKAISFIFSFAIITRMDNKKSTIAQGNVEKKQNEKIPQNRT